MVVHLSNMSKPRYWQACDFSWCLGKNFQTVSVGLMSSTFYTKRVPSSHQLNYHWDNTFLLFAIGIWACEGCVPLDQRIGDTNPIQTLSTDDHCWLSVSCPLLQSRLADVKQYSPIYKLPVWRDSFHRQPRDNCVGIHVFCDWVPL